MTPEEFAENVRRTILKLRQEVPNLIRAFGDGLRYDVSARVQTQGLDAYGRTFAPYSKSYELWKSGAYRIQASKKTLKSGKLSKGRKRPDKYQGFRDLTLSGEMMKNFNVFKEGADYILGFSDDKMEERAGFNNETSGAYNIIEPSAKEIEKQTEYFNNALLKIIKEGLGQ